MFFISDSQIDAILREDIPWSDATTEALGIEDAPGRIACYPKVDGVVAGVAVAARLFERVGLDVSEAGRDGDFVKAGHRVLVASGSAGRIHAVYKTAQNVMEYASGIAGRCRAMVEAARSANPRAQVAVTRKHFPGAKAISLSAALAGGAIVHRAGLSESILVFDQHRVFCDDVARRIAEARAREPEKKVAVEAATVAEAVDFARWGADIVQCERFGCEELAEAARRCKAVNPAVVINAAGGVNASNARDIAAAGADVLVTSWPYFGRPFDIKMQISAIRDEP
ncbi:MAG: ModD protein [Duodenibacillus sp.]|nr:ModD protein [Duodenibacillus sp.]